MSTTVDQLESRIRALPEAEKLRLLDAILRDLDKPDPEIDQVWVGPKRPERDGKLIKQVASLQSLTKK